MKTNPITVKKIMALSGLFWFLYLLMHMLTNLNFFLGEQSFNGFYQWFNNVFILRYGLLFILLLTLIYHVVVAATRQQNNNKKRPIDYHQSYPKVIPRFIAWSGALLLLAFIVYHIIEMNLLRGDDNYAAMIDLFQQPITWLIYLAGLFALSAHLHHSLLNVFQTLGKHCNQANLIVITILVILIGGFLLPPLYIVLCLT